MKIPKEVKIGGKVYKIVYPYKFKESNDHIGQSDHEKQIILISDTDSSGNKRHRQNIEETFLHELLHCIDWIYNAGELRDKLGESGIERTSEGLYQVLKDNNLLK